MLCAGLTPVAASSRRLPAATRATTGTAAQPLLPDSPARTAADWTPLGISTLPTPTTTACAWWDYTPREVSLSCDGGARVRRAPHVWSKEPVPSTAYRNCLASLARGKVLF